MWFRNARIYRFTKPFTLSEEVLEEKLSEGAFKPCGPQDSAKLGWVAPLGRHGQQKVFSSGGCHMVCLRKEEKLLPAAVVKEAVDERVELIEQEQARPVRRKEKNEIRDQLELEMLPRAFSRSRHTFAYISPADGLLVVDASSANAAEALTSHLRETLGSLPVRPPVVNQAPAFTMTGWVTGNLDVPQSLALEDECELRDDSEEGGVIRVKGFDLREDEIRAHLEGGMEVTRLALNWDDELSFTLDSELAVRRLKFGDGFQDKLDDIEADDAAAKFDASFQLMTLEFARLVPALLEAFGGEDRSAIVDG